MNNIDVQFEILKNCDAVSDWKNFSDVFPLIKENGVFWKRLQKLKLFNINSIIDLDWVEAIEHIDIDYTTILSNDYNTMSETMLKLLLSKNAQIDGDDPCPLVRAIEKNNFDLVKLLIKYQASINCDEGKETYYPPLHAACVVNNVDSVNYLLEHGADPNIQGWNLLDTYLFDYEHDECYINLDTTDCITPLFTAIRNKNVAMVQLLLSYGADKTHEAMVSLYTPRMLAGMSTDPIIRNLLLK